MQTNISAPRFLAVDDEPEMSDLLVRMLTAHGFRGASCTDGNQALSMLGQQKFHAILADLNMPGMDGMELLNVVRTKFPDIAFVMITGTDDIQPGVRAMKAGASDYLLKPFQGEAVVASLHRALEMKRLERELEKHRNGLEETVKRRTRQLEQAMNRVEKTYEETLQVLGHALDLRDNETAGHCQRVTRYSLELGKAMNCTSLQLKEIARGAYLHDVGKIGIPDAILLKPGPLSEKEKLTMQAHVRIGYDLIRRISFLESAAEIILCHQERFDGSGYPRGLTGTEIPLGARIFAVADTLDAMTSDRPYRRALPYAAAREEIARESGGQFDPDVVRVFLAVPEQLWKRIRVEVELQTALPVDNAVERVVVGSEDQQSEGLLQMVPSTEPPEIIRKEAQPPKTLEEVERAYIQEVLVREGWRVEEAARVLAIPRSSLYHKIKQLGLSRSNARLTSVALSQASVREKTTAANR